MTKVHALGPLRRRIFTDTLILLRRAARELAANDPRRLGAATAFFTTFALPPILIILIQVMGSLYSAVTVRRPAGLPAFRGLIGRRARHWNNATGTTSADSDRSAHEKRADRHVPAAPCGEVMDGRRLLGSSSFFILHSSFFILHSSFFIKRKWLRA
jgi:hypothetical protein